MRLAVLGAVYLLAGMAPAFAQGERNLAGKTVRMVIGSATSVAVQKSATLLRRVRIAEFG